MPMKGEDYERPAREPADRSTIRPIGVGIATRLEGRSTLCVPACGNQGTGRAYPFLADSGSGRLDRLECLLRHPILECVLRRHSNIAGARQDAGGLLFRPQEDAGGAIGTTEVFAPARSNRVCLSRKAVHPVVAPPLFVNRTGAFAVFVRCRCGTGACSRQSPSERSIQSCIPDVCGGGIMATAHSEGRRRTEGNICTGESGETPTGLLSPSIRVVRNGHCSRWRVDEGR